MIITSVIILIIAGLSHELQAPLHYKYKYFASVSTGIPELSSQASGWAMKADVEVFVQKDDVPVIFKLSNTRTVEFNENLGCDSRGEIPESRFAPISDPDLASAIEAPFRVRLYGNEGKSVEYYEGKYRWLANFRKGIASAFKNEVLRGNIKSETDGVFHNENPANVFSIDEDTIFGKCDVQYKWNEIPSHISGRTDFPFKEQKEMDVQFEGSETEEANPQASTNYSTTEAPKDISYLHVVRTVNFDSCNEMVGFQINSIEHSEVTKGQHDWRRGRSSVSEYIFLGRHRKFRLERAIIEGATLVAPFGFQTELLQARTNQTFQLVSVTKDGEIPHVSDEFQTSPTWMYEVWSFAEYPSHSKPRPWVVYTGEGDAIGRFETFGLNYRSSEQIDEIKKVIISKITTAAIILSDQYQSSKVDRTESPSKLLQDSSFLFKFLSEKTALEVFGTFFEKDSNNTNLLARKLVIDAAAASGFHYVTDAIMVYVREGKLSDLQVATFFMTLASNAECACAIPGILDWVLTLDIKERPFLTSTVLINFAHLVNEMCLYPKARNVNFAGPSFGDARCDRQKIMKEFRPYVAKLLEDKNEWVKIVGIHVVSALGDPNALALVVPFIENKLYSNMLRIQAIYALDEGYLNRYDHLGSHIEHLLTQIYVNIEENVAVREAALTVVSTWIDDPSFYHTLARISWREPSKRFASFITSFIKNEAGYGIAAASFALKLSKPTIPSLTFSNTFSSYRKDKKKRISSFDSVDVFKSKTLSDIIHLSLYSDYQFEDFDFTILWAAMFIEGGPVIRNLFHHFSEFKASSEARSIKNNIHDKIEESLNFIFNVPEDKKKKDYLNIYVKFLQHLQVLLPVNNYTLSNLATPSYSAAQFVEFLRNGSELVLGKFLNPVDFTMFHPTEIGLPLFISGSSPAVITEVLSIKSREETHKSDLVAFSLGSFSSEFHSRLSVLLPWNQKQIETGIKSTRDVTLPFQTNAGFVERGPIFRLPLGLECTYLDEAFSVAKASNAPYTSIGPIVPLGNDPSKKIISKSEPKKQSVPMPILRQFTGFDLHLELEAEEPALFFANWNPIDLLSSKQTSTPYLFYAYASPTVKYWSADLKFNATPQNHQIDLIFFKAYAHKNEIASQYRNKQERMARQQESGQQEVKDNEDNNCRNILQKSRFLDHCFGEFVSAKNIILAFGRQSYDITTSASEEQNSKSNKIKWFHLQLLHEIKGEVEMVCLDFKQSEPVLSSLDTFENVINADLHKKIRVDLTHGCEGDPVLTVEGLYQISDLWKRKYQNDAQEACDFDPLDSLHTFRHNAVYDHVNFSVTFDKVYDRKKYPITKYLFEFGNGLFDHKIFTHNCENEELQNKFEVKLNRCPVSENWFIDFHGQAFERQYVLPHSNLFNSLFGVADKDAEYSPSHLSTNRESDKCIVGSDLVRTFDGFTFHYKPTECWIVAAQSCSTKTKKLLVRSSGSESAPEAKYIDDTKGLVIEFLKNTLTVNGKVVDASNGKETIKNDDGKDMVVIRRKNHYYTAELSENSYINFKDRVEVRIDTAAWGDICGLCGNNDGEPEGDLVEPQGCIYDDPSTFAASWAEESDLCDKSTLSELKEDAKIEQHAHCQTVNHISKKDTLCMAHEWNATYNEGDLCVSPWPIPYCEDACDVAEYSDVSVTYYCWPQDFVPVVIKDSSELTEEVYLESLGYEHHWEEERWVSIPKFCKNPIINS